MTVARIKDDGVTETVSYLHQNHLGSPVAATDTGGTVLWREDYTPFGEERQDPAANDNDENFTGHIRDEATGLLYMQARYMDPVIGRFLSNDPVSFSPDQPQMFNRYSYTLNDPVYMHDPDGEFPQAFAAGVVGFAAGTLINAGVQKITTGSVNWGDAVGAGLGAGAAAAAISINPALAASPGALAALSGITSAGGSLAGDALNGESLNVGDAVAAGVGGLTGGVQGGLVGQVFGETAGTIGGVVVGETIGAAAAEASPVVQDGVAATGAAIHSGVEALSNLDDVLVPDIDETENDL